MALTLFDGVIFARVRSTEGWDVSPKNPAKERRKSPTTGRWQYRDAGGGKGGEDDGQAGGKSAPAPRSQKRGGDVSSEADHQDRLNKHSAKLKEVKEKAAAHVKKHGSNSVNDTIARDNHHEKAVNELHKMKLHEMRHQDLKKLAKGHSDIKQTSKMSKEDLVKSIHKSVSSAYEPNGHGSDKKAPKKEKAEKPAKADKPAKSDKKAPDKKVDPSDHMKSLHKHIDKNIQGPHRKEVKRMAEHYSKLSDEELKGEVAWTRDKAKKSRGVDEIALAHAAAHLTHEHRQKSSEKKASRNGTA